MTKKVFMGCINVHNVRRIEITRQDGRWRGVVLVGDDGDDVQVISAFTPKEGDAIEVIDHERPSDGRMPPAPPAEEGEPMKQSKEPSFHSIDGDRRPAQPELEKPLPPCRCGCKARTIEDPPDPSWRIVCDYDEDGPGCDARTPWMPTEAEVRQVWRSMMVGE